MEITAECFWEKLPGVLTIIAEADYVALDLEMTGVQVRDSLETGTIGLDQAYGRIKAAAGTFSAIQLGATAIRWADSAYETHTFTIPISTLIPRNSREENQLSTFLDRKLTLSSNSLNFLHRHKFDLEEAMTFGVPYLSREERRLVSEQLWQESNGKRVRVDMVTLDDFDVDFVEGLRKEVRRWCCTDPPLGAILEIPEPRGINMHRSTVALANFIVADEFPQCRCWRPKHCSAMNITLRSVDRDAETSEARKLAFAKQFGLSWVIEALIGIQDLQKYENMARAINSMLAASSNPLQSAREPTRWQDEGEQHWQDLLRKLQNHPPVLMGHNVVYDLAFLHSMFIGELPDKLSEFRARINDLFPRILDTKLLLSQTVNPNMIDPSLEDLFLELQVQAYPFVQTAAPGWGFTRYSAATGANKGSSHNAGFDSYMTAVVFLKVCCKRMRLQKRATIASNRGEFALSSREDVDSANSWYNLVDGQTSAMDKFLEGDDICLPNFESDFFAPVRNKLRMCTAGVLNLEVEQGVDSALTAGRKHSDHGACEKNADAVAGIHDLYHEMQGLVDDIALLRANLSNRGSGDFCSKLEAAHRRMEQTRDKVRSFLSVAEVPPAAF